MRSISMAKVIGLSFSRTTAILFSPFSLKKWVILFFIAAFAGSLSIGNNMGRMGSNSSKNSNTPITTFNKQATLQSNEPAGFPPDKAPVTVTHEESGQVQAGLTGEKASSAVNQPMQSGPAMQPALILSIVLGVIILVFVLFLVMVWLGSRFQFIWFNAVASNNASIVEPFHRHRMQANSLFGTSLLLYTIFIPAFLSPIVWALINAGISGAFKPEFVWTLKAGLSLFLGPIILFFILLALTILLAVAITNFVIPIMAVEKISFLPALKKTMGIYKSNILDVVLFHFILLALSIALGLIFLALAVVLLIVLIIIGALLYFAGYYLLVTALKSMVVFFVYAALATGFLAALLFFMFVVVTVPPSVFLRAYSIEYLCALNCGFDYDRLALYSQDTSPERSKKWILIPMIFISTTVFVLIFGMLAAIAIPNFIQARNAAKTSQAK